MGATGMAFAVVMVVVVAADIGIKVQCACQEQGNSLIGIATDTAVELNTSLAECHLCAAADAAADQNIGIQCAQNTGQCAVTEYTDVVAVAAGDYTTVLLFRDSTMAVEGMA